MATLARHLAWIAPLAAVALSVGLIRFAPPGVAIALPVLAVMLVQGWHRRRADRAAADAWLFDHAVAVAACWAIAWTLVLVVHPLLALLAGFAAMFAWLGWRRQRGAYPAG
jgi:uncharacterized protein (TIGR03382 family)